MLTTILIHLLDAPARDHADENGAGNSDSSLFSASIRRLVHSTALVWIGYFMLLALLDHWFVMRRPGSQNLPARYYLAYIGVGALLLTITSWRSLQLALGRALLPLIIVCMSVVPIAIVPLFLPNLPAGPIMVIPGLLSLRLLPIVCVGLILVAWQYQWRHVVAYTFAVMTLTIVMNRHTSALNTVFALNLIQALNMLTFGYAISTMMAHLQTQRAELVQANLDLRHYASTLEHLTVSRERNRVARELHDTLAHTLSGLTVQLETIKAYWNVDAATAWRMVETATATARSGLQETRLALKALRISPLEDLGLRLAIATLAETMAATANLRLNLELAESVPALAPDSEHALYRIAQEAIANVVQHAAASTLALRLTLDPGMLTLTVQDDGRGFDLEQDGPAGHFGIAGVRERAALIGAALTLTSAPGHGTTLGVTLPI